MKDSKSEPKKDNFWQKTQYANLIRYVPSGVYYARVRVKGKLLKRSLETKSISVAKLKLGDFEKAERQRAERLGGNESDKMTFGDALGIFQEFGYRPMTPKRRRDKIKLKPRAFFYYEQTVTALRKRWPELERTRVRDIKPEHIEEWSRNFLAERSASAHNHTLGLLRNVFEIAVKKGAIYENPAMDVLRAPELPKELILPTRDQFHAFVSAIETSGSGKSRPCANLVRFLAYGGFRKDEAPHITWRDCSFDRGVIMVRGNPEDGTKGSDSAIREIQMIPEMRELLLSLRSKRQDEPEANPIMEVRECQKAMDRAAKQVGMARITHHDLRHLFATRCIESGVDIPTVSRWLGHKDGGALAMRVYGHLQTEHSASMAKRVSFRKPENIVEIGKAVGE